MARATEERGSLCIVADLVAQVGLRSYFVAFRLEIGGTSRELLQMDLDLGQGPGSQKDNRKEGRDPPLGAVRGVTCSARYQDTKQRA